MFMRPFAILASAALSILSLALPARGQCEPEWVPTGYGQNITGTVQCFAQFDPDGTGPQPLSLIVGGSGLRRPGSTDSSKLMAYDGPDWSLIEQSGGSVYDMTVYNGQLIVAGFFSSVVGVPANSIAAWNGTTWSALGAGISGGQVNALAVVGGFLFVGGNFTTAGGISTSDIARWDGTDWASIGSVSIGGRINALVGFQGQLYAGGQFTSVGGVTAANLASYNPTSNVWSPAGNPNGEIFTLAQFTALAVTNSRLYVGGTFSLIDGVAVTNAARFTPVLNTWVSLGSPASATRCNKLFVRSTGISSHQTTGLWRGPFDSTGQAFVLSGTTWNTLNNIALPSCSTITYFAGQYTLGRANILGDGSNVKRWDGAAWAPLGEGAPGFIRSLAVEGTQGDVIAGVQLESSFGDGFAGIARRSATTGVWTQLGDTFNYSSTAFGAAVYAVTTRPNGEVFAGGFFNNVGSTPILGLARWNGSSWSQVGSGVSGSVNALLTMPNGDVIVGGPFSMAGGIQTGSIARWDGSSWFALGTGISGHILSLALLPNGDLIAGGEFTSPANNVARWNGTTWSGLGSGTNGSVYCVTAAPDGSIYVGGDFSTAGGFATANVARWNGANNWSALGSGLGGTYPWPYAMAVLDDSTLVVGGDFTTAGGNPIANLARWNGSAWSTWDGGTSGGYVSSVVKLPTGKFAIGGAFTHANNLPSAYLALWGVPDGCSNCDSIDFNNDTSLFDPQDIEAFLSVYSEGPCIPGTATCNDIDFNNDSSLFDPCDIEAFLLVFSEGPCTACGT